jgi:pyruvate-formate lyase-activating enzyme
MEKCQYLVTSKFGGPRKGRSPEINASLLEYFRDLQNKVLPVTREALMENAKECARKSNVPFKACHGWCEKFMKRESLSLG